jgi:DNA-binding MarR family transcriptional regulator/N-acetylglutamate synthase-like GNAT family acetyltransferase
MDEQITALRAFNRAYTRHLGLLDANYDGSPFSLSEARILYEIATRPDLTSAALARSLRLDPAQVSRTLRRFADRNLLERADRGARRGDFLSLTSAGRAAFAALDSGTQASVAARLKELGPDRSSRLISAAHEIVQLFETEQDETTLRGLRAGDLGLVTSRQAILYAQEYGWNRDYEALVSQILAQFHTSFDPAKDDAWIADRGGRVMGSVFLVHSDTPGVGKLRLLYVEPEARGQQTGRRLVDRCIARASEFGYERLELWTNSVLVAARRLYERAGFRLIQEAPHHSFGQDLVGQTWALDLRRKS